MGSHRHWWSNSKLIPLRIASPFSIFRFSPLRLFLVSKSEEMVRRKEIHHQRRTHPKQRFILKGWINHIIRTAWKNWRIVGSSVSNWKETMLRSKNESIKKNVFYYVFLKTYCSHKERVIFLRVLRSVQHEHFMLSLSLVVVACVIW